MTIGGIMEDLGKVKLTKEQQAELTIEELQEYKSARRKSLKQAIKYFLCAASAGVIQIVTFSILQAIIKSDKTIWFMVPGIPLGDFIATTIALGLSILWNFTLNRKFTFQSAGNVPRAMLLAFLFYVPFYPFQTWYVPTIKAQLVAVMPGMADLAGIVAEATVMVINFILEFCWQKFVIYRKEENSALAKYNAHEIGPNGEITPAKDTFNGMEMYELLHSGVDVNALDDKHLKKILKEKEF
jgi:putative flippase GtrA